MSFQIHALPKEPFDGYFDLTPKQLTDRGAHLETVTNHPGFPCRVSMTDAPVGSTVVLLNYQHQSANTPYQAAHAIYVTKNVAECKPAINEIPQVLSSRIMSIRGFSKDHMMKEADVVEGAKLHTAIEKMFLEKSIDYIHLHNAKQGCYAAKVTRA
jgi:hypothetical protein